MFRGLLRETCQYVFSQCGFPSCLKQTMSCFSSSSKTNPTAGIIVIGDEILKGQVRDSNSHFIISKLYSIGVRVMKVSVIGDDVDEISNEVRKFSHLYTYVITSGGIGPTHDDVTFEGVAKAFEEKTFPHPELVKICSDFYKTTDLTSPAMKLACVPMSAKLKFGFDPIQNCMTKYPNVSVQNVYIFPGVPPLLERSFSILCEELFGRSGSKFHKAELYIDATEVSIADNLSKVVEEFPAVTVGSYPQQNNSYYRIKVTVEAKQSDLLTQAVKRLRELIPPDYLVNFDSEPLESSFEKIQALGLETGMSHITSSIQDMFQACSESRPEETVLCIDASLSGIATLHLMYAIQKKLQRKDPVQTVIITSDNTLGMEHFVNNVLTSYPVRMIGEPNKLNIKLSSIPADLKLLVAGCRYSSSTLQDALLKMNSMGNISIFSPVSTWTEAQILQFITKLNLPYVNEQSPR
ncbi:FAD synthase [Frankliniella fusca]|uniref:FAD synthase n=1 Tax=Frankliniella fusca TaxID=407009 RepID=A0AAE1GXN3_9NEOP|nr:FAD synthase [Frankliniella fusca]